MNEHERPMSKSVARRLAVQMRPRDAAPSPGIGKLGRRISILIRDASVEELEDILVLLQAKLADKKTNLAE